MTAPGRPGPEPAELHGQLHHVELWVSDLAATKRSLGWLLGQLGYEVFQDWPAGRSWRLGPTYVVAEQSPALLPGGHDRLRAGLNHLAFHVAGWDQVDRLVKESPEHGWALMFADRHPFAGGEAHYAAYLEDSQGFEVELVAVD
ncbi:VOC family protein [Actinopolymorpha alba]|uniref:VOC family protein n=1 Tax=Actinopolymorpha alba TaxID=533267 RepID=UPI00037DEB2E|nr:VOC family protein [Actinopolymorpha alba]